MVILSDKVLSNLNNIKEKIIGKRVLIFDLETSGLFDFKQYYKYWSNEIFDGSRIVEIGYYYTDNFQIDTCTDTDESVNIHTYLRKPLDFDHIDPESERVHNMSIEYLKSNGFKFSQILNNGLIKILNNVDYIISHNTKFDFYILLNELNRLGLSKTINYLINLQKDKRLLCTCMATGYCKLEKLYMNRFNEIPVNVHRAGDDVKTLLEILICNKVKYSYIDKIN